MIEAKIFLSIINDPSFYDFKKMKYKYGEETLNDVIYLMKSTIHKKINIVDFNKNNLVYCPSLINVSDKTYKSLLDNNNNESYSVSQMESEIKSTLEIENIESSRNSIRSILNGNAPKDFNENKIFGIKQGLDFISDKNNRITEKNIFDLYMTSVGNYLSPDEQLLPNNFYRHDAVYVLGSDISHQGLDFKLVPEYMSKFVQFISQNDSTGAIIKSVIIHFYFAYIHPYFDGNGRMARLMQLWYLIQNDFNSTLMVSFSQLISKTKNLYYKTFEDIEKNLKISGVIDVTPFILYFNENVFDKLQEQKLDSNVVENFQKYLEGGDVTLKEKDLFLFVMSFYGENEFSTKTLEKDFKNAAYATIRSFVIKFERMGLLSSQKYGNRTRYKINV